MNLSNALLLAVAAAVAAGHPSIRGGSDGGDELRRRLAFPDPPDTCPVLPNLSPYQPCCGEPPCWCDLDAESTSSSDMSSGDIDECPLYPIESIYLSRPDIIEFFASLDLVDGCETPEICQPDLSTSENLDGNSIAPSLLDIILPEALPCDKVRGNKVCGIQFKYGDGPISPSAYVPDCNEETSMRATHYKVKTFRNKNQLNRAGYFVLHEGDCGVCSTAQDLAIYMEYSFGGLTLSQIPGICYQCTVQALLPSYGFNPLNIPPKLLVDELSLCLEGSSTFACPVPQGFGFTEGCATAWAVNTFFTGLPNAVGGCLDKCLKLQSGEDDPYVVETCELHPCLRCDDSVNGDLFEQLAGMTRRGAGLHTVIPRPCGSLADVTHSCVAKMMPI
ncbi:hypothetical protein ACHAXT_004268 [Thalassiosira profunda]